MLGHVLVEPLVGSCHAKLLLLWSKSIITEDDTIALLKKGNVGGLAAPPLKPGCQRWKLTRTWSGGESSPKCYSLTQSHTILGASGDPINIAVNTDLACPEEELIAIQRIMLQKALTLKAKKSMFWLCTMTCICWVNRKMLSGKDEEEK